MQMQKDCIHLELPRAIEKYPGTARIAEDAANLS
jgi:hypothetical protein